MRPGQRKRLAKIEGIIGSVPIPPEVVKAAFDRFRETGELPEDKRLAWMVIERAQAGFDTIYDAYGQVQWGATIQARLLGPQRAADPTLDELYGEAVFGTGMVRFAARQMLRAFASAGSDVTQPLFLDWDPELSDYGAVGLQLMGFPEILAKPPYKLRARRLFAQLDQLRQRVPQGDRRWFDAVERAVENFQTRGIEPEDELLREVVLSDAEMRALMLHFGGEDVRELLEGIDARARR